MRKKLIAILMLCMIIVTTFSGCTKKIPSNGANGGEEENTTSQIPQGVSDSSEVNLVVWGAQEDQELLNEMIEAFKELHKQEASFNITIAPESESSCKDTLMGDLQAGADVFAFADDQLNTLVAAGALEKVKDVDTIKAANSESSIEAASINGTLYAYPMTADNGYMMFYNKKYFTNEDVKTLDKMMEVAAGHQKKVSMDWSSAWYIYSFFGATGLELGVNPDGITNYCTWNATEGTIKGIDVAQAMLDIAANPGFISGVDTSFVEGMKDGSIIAGVSGVWNAVAAKEAWGEDFAATKLPTYTCAGEQVQMSSFAGYKMIGVNAYSKHADWATKLAEWITSEENQTLRFEKRGQGPSNTLAAASEAVAKSPAIAALIEQSEFASLQRVGGNFWTPVADFAAILLEGNQAGQDLQKLVDTMVEGVTAQK